MLRREGGNVRERGEENAWRSEKGERRMTKYIVHVGRGVKRRKFKCIRQKGRV